MILRTGKEIRENFKLKYFDIFSVEERNIIQSEWDEYFKGSQMLRNNQIWFNLTTSELGKNGSKYLNGLYGGEQVYKPLIYQNNIIEKLSKIGAPILVKTLINPSRFRYVFFEPYGMIIASSLIRRKYPEFLQFDTDVSIDFNMPYSELHIEELSEEYDLE